MNLEIFGTSTESTFSIGADPPEDETSVALYHLRSTLLSMPAPGHKIGQPSNDLEPGGIE